MRYRLSKLPVFVTQFCETIWVDTSPINGDYLEPPNIYLVNCEPERNNIESDWIKVKLHIEPSPDKTDTYKVQSVINFQVFKFWFHRKLTCIEPQQSTENQANIMSVQYFCWIWSYMRINRSGVKLALSFILSLLYLITIFANLLSRICFRLLHQQSTLSPSV